MKFNNHFKKVIEMMNIYNTNNSSEITLGKYHMQTKPTKPNTNYKLLIFVYFFETGTCRSWEHI